MTRLNPTCKNCGNPRSAHNFDWEKCPVGGRMFHESPTADPVNNPAHYTQHPSGVECIQVTEHMGFNLGNAVKYIWRCDLKRDAIEDLEKARWYIDREIDKRKRAEGGR